MNPLLHRSLSLACIVSMVGLIILGVAWESTLAPLRPGGSWMVLKVVPLLFPLPGVFRRDVYTLQWSSMLVLIYFAEGVVRVTTEGGLSFWLAAAEVALSLVFFFCSLLYLRPYKKEAKRLAREAIRKASESVNE